MYIEVKDACKRFVQDGKEFVALDHVSLDIEKGEFICLLGPSGCGKSTLLNALAGFDRVNSGSVKIDGKEVTEPSINNITIFQNYGLLPWRNVLKNVELGLESKKIPKEERADIARKYIDLVGLKGFEERHPRQLSGGQQQRTSIGRAIVKNPDILLCDEPTGALDYKTSKDILKLIETINQKYGNTVIIVTHNDAIKLMADKVIKLRDGNIRKEYENTEKVNAEELDW